VLDRPYKSKISSVMVLVITMKMIMKINGFSYKAYRITDFWYSSIAERRDYITRDNDVLCFSRSWSDNRMMAKKYLFQVQRH